MTIQWQWSKFGKLKTSELYEIMRLRQQVFVVEQNCVYLDADGLDRDAWHLCGWVKSSNGVDAETLAAYLRVLPAGKKFKDTMIGRVVTASEYRRNGLGLELMREGLKKIRSELGDVSVRISAQSYLEKFYTELGFKKIGDPYLEDGILHVEMVV